MAGFVHESFNKLEKLRTKDIDVSTMVFQIPV